MGIRVTLLHLQPYYRFWDWEERFVRPRWQFQAQSAPQSAKVLWQVEILAEKPQLVSLTKKRFWQVCTHGNWYLPIFSSPYHTIPQIKLPASGCCFSSNCSYIRRHHIWNMDISARHMADLRLAANHNTLCVLRCPQRAEGGACGQSMGEKIGMQ